MQRLALFKLVSERRKLTTVHDVSGAWTGIGAVIHILWQQRKRSLSTREIKAVGAYLSMMLVLHITSSSIMRWQERQSYIYPDDVDFQMNLAMPDSSVDISQLGWTEIFPIVRSVLVLNLATIQNNTLYDTPLIPTDGVWAWAFSVDLDRVSRNATTFTAQCGLVPNLTLSYANSEKEYEISFLNTLNGSFLEPAICK